MATPAPGPVEPYGVSELTTQLEGAAHGVLPYVAAGIAAGLIVFVVVWGVRLAFRFVRDVGEYGGTHDSGAIDQWNADYDAAYAETEGLGWTELERERIAEMTADNNSRDWS